MSLVTLPQEVLETLLLYVGIEDLPSVWDAINFEGSELFWETLCKREGYTDIFKDGNWKNIFYANINWITQKFVKREYKLDKVQCGRRPRLYDRHISRIECLLNRDNIALRLSEYEITLCNIDKYPVLIQLLPRKFIRVSRTKIVTRNATAIKIYSCINNNTCWEILNLDNNFSHSIDIHYALTDKYFAALHDRTFIKVFNFEIKECFILQISPKRVICIELLGCILYVMENSIQECQIVLRRCNLEKIRWLDDIILIQEVNVLSTLYKLEVSLNLLAIWSSEVVTIPLKIWKSNGECLNSISINCIRFPDIIRWLILEGDYIIWSTHNTNIKIWNSKVPDKCKTMYLSEGSYIGQNVICSSILVLSYSYCFKVVDYTKAVYLYDVPLENNMSIKRLPYFITSGHHKYFVNEHFYVHIRDVEIYKPSERAIKSDINLSASPSTNANYTFGESSHARKRIKTKCSIDTILTIYDFRVNN